MINAISILGVFVIIALWCTAQSFKCDELAKFERDSYKQGILYRDAKRFMIACYILTVLGAIAFIFVCSL